MTLTNKDKKALIEGLAIQLKNSSIEEYNSFVIECDKYMQTIFLDWFNDYITREKFAGDYGIDVKRADQLIEEGRAIHERLVKDQITTKASKELGMNKKALDDKLIFITG